MKTVFIIAGGIADIPDPELDGKTPLMLASTPSLDALARCGCCGSMLVTPDGVPVTTANATLSLLGYDFDRGVPDPAELTAFGVSPSRVIATGSSLRYFVVPKFSCRGVVISHLALIRGIGKMAMLKPMTVAHRSVDLGSDLRADADAAIAALGSQEFVLLHVDAAERSARMGDIEGKKRAIELIDSEVIAPIADFVWGADEQMTMVVTADHITSWRTGRPMRGEVPAAVYFNDDPPGDIDSFDELSVVDGSLATPRPGDLMRRLVSFNSGIDDND